MIKFDKDELYLIRDFLEYLQEEVIESEDQLMMETTIDVIKKLIKE